MRVLAVGAHPDDIELGCGGTLLAHRTAGDEVVLLVMTAGERGAQGPGSRMAEAAAAAAMLGAELCWAGFADGSVPEGRKGVDAVGRVLACLGPDVVYTHAPADSHQDHRATATATLGAARRVRRVLCYESPTSLRFVPSLTVEIAKHLEGKADLVRAHASQVAGCELLDLEALEAVARYRGQQSRGGAAEAFEVHRFAWDLTR